MELREAFELLLDRMDESYKELKRIHSDASFLNSDAKDYRKALERFNECQEAVFSFKAVWAHVSERD